MNRSPRLLVHVLMIGVICTLLTPLIASAAFPYATPYVHQNYSSNYWDQGYPYLSTGTRVAPGYGPVSVGITSTTDVSQYEIHPMPVIQDKIEEQEYEPPVCTVNTCPGPPPDIEDFVPGPNDIVIDVNDSLGSINRKITSAFAQGGDTRPLTDVTDRMLSLDPTLVRISHLFTDGVTNPVNRDEEGNLQYNWSELDAVVDAILTSGAEPIMNLSFTPYALNPKDKHAIPLDINEWRDVVRATVYHYNVERNLNLQYWEFWNEPLYKLNALDPFNPDPTFHETRWTYDLFVDFYEATAEEVKSVDPSAWIGGLSFSGHPQVNEAIDRFLREVSLREIPLDFLSFHKYGPGIDYDVLQYKAAVEYVQERVEWYLPNNDVALMLTEWGINSNGKVRFLLESPRNPAFIAASIPILLDSPLYAATHFTPTNNSRTYWRLINHTDNSVTPSYNVFSMITLMGNTRLDVQESLPDIYPLVTRDTDDTIAIMVSYLDIYEVLPAKSVRFVIKNSGMSDSVAVEQYVIDSIYSNLFYDPAHQELTMTERYTIQADDPLILDLTLAPNSVLLLRLVE